MAFGQVPGYNNRKKFKVNSSWVQGASAHSNFPVLVNLTDTDFRSTGNGSGVESPNGYDIVFTSADGTTALDHDLEAYNAATGEIIFWVRFPSLSASSDTEFFIYYGNASQTVDQSVASTWDTNYQMVLHMDDLADATSKSNNGTNHGTSSTTGVIGNARSFAANNNDYISVADNPTLDLTTDITISFWVNANNFGSTPDLVTKGTYTQAYSSWIRGNGTLRLSTNGNTITSSSSISSGSQTYITFTKNTSGRAIYINGSPSGSDNNTTNFNTNNNPLYISTNGYPINGMVDEVRISNIARSANWVATEYNNQNNPSAFITEIADPPSLSTIESLPQSFFSGGSPVFITSSLTVSHPSITNLQSATVEVTGNYINTEDVLAFTNQNGITGSWNSGTGILSLSGTATLAQYEAVLQSVTYNNTNSSNPNQSTRTVSFTVNDGSDNSNSVSRTINIITAYSDLSTDIQNPVFHFDAQDVNGDLNLGNQPADGSLVATWGDRSDNALGSGPDLSATNASASDQPIFNSMYFGERGGILWDGTNDNLNLPTNAILNNGTFNQKSFGIVFRTGSSVDGLQIVYEQGNNEYGYQISIKDGNAYAYTYSYFWGFFPIDNSTINLGSVEPNESYIVIATHDATSGSGANQTWKASINGGAVQTTTGVGAREAHASAPVIGAENSTRDPVTFANNPSGTNNFSGYIGEFASWNTSFSESEILSVYNYLCDKWCNEPPVLAAIEQTDLDFTEGGSPTSVTSSITVSDTDNTTIDSAKVYISANFQSSEDVLDFTAVGNITGSYSSTTGLLLLTGTDSKANYQTALRSVTYQNTNAVNPSTALRTVSFEVYDWDDVSSSISRNVNVIGINSSPTLSGITGGVLTYNEGSGPVNGSAAFNVSITDVDDVNMEGAEIEITNNYTLGEDVLGFVSQNGISGSWNSITAVLTLTGTASIASYEAALEAVTYENISADPVELTRTISFTVNDGDNNSNTQSRDLQVVATNSKPVLSNIETSRLTYQNAPIQITQTLEVSDPDDTQLDSAWVSITQNFKTSEDSLLFTDIFGISGTYNTGTGKLRLTGTASLNDYQSALRTVLYDNYATIPTGPEREISFTAFDGQLASDASTRLIEVNAVEAINGLEVWLRADAGVVTSGSQVVSWEDQSGNNNHFAGMTGAGTRPTAVSSSSSLNNKPSVNFAGNGDFFEDADGENYINGSSEFTIFLVHKSNQTNTDRGLFIAETPAGEDKTLTIRYDASGANNNGSFTNVVKTGILSNSPANQLESFSDIQTTKGQIISYQWQSGNTYDIFIDGILNNPSAAGPPPTGTISGAGTAIVGKGGKDHPNGTNQSWDGEIAEFIYYGRLLTQPEREKVEDYLSEKYSLSIRKITPASGGEQISADNANATYTALTGPIIKEGFAGELSSGGTIVLEAPSGFEWNTGAAPSVSTSSVYGGSTTLAASFTGITATQATFTVNTASGSNPGQVEISGLQVRPTTGILPNSGNITNSGTTALGASTNYGSLAMVAGAADSLIIAQQPSASNVNTSISPAIRVQLADQYGNHVMQSATSVSMSLSTGTGTLSGTNPVSTNSLGIADFSDLQIDATGTKKLTASSTGLKSTESAAFNIVNAGVLTGFTVERVPSGNISPKLAGQDFNIKITAVDGSGTAVTTFSGSVVLTSSCSMGKGQGTTANFSSGELSSLTVNVTSIGNCTLTATNSAGSESGTSNAFSVSPGVISEAASVITASPTVILNDGSSTSTITLQAKDAYGNNITTGGETVVFSTNHGSVGSVTDNVNGAYTATLTSSTAEVVATVTGTINGNAVTDNASVEFANFSHIWESQLGSVSDATNWYDPDNWNVNSVPSSSSVILVPASPAVGNEFPVVNQPNTVVSALSLEANASLTVSGSTNFTVSGDVTGDGNILGSNNDVLSVGGNLDIQGVSLGTVIFNGSSDQELISPNSFGNIEIDNPGTVSISADLTITNTLTLTDGELLVPSDINLIASTHSYSSGNLRFQRAITGVRGWRMLSSPVLSSFGDFLDGTLTQGYAGATYSTGSNPGDTLQPNVMWYLENFHTNKEGLPATDNDRLRAPGNATDQVVSGRGYWVYFFGDISADPLYNNPLPDTLDVTGREFGAGASEVDFGVTYTPSADSGWNFVGNPYGAAINWSNASKWTKTNIESTIYIWDPAANSGNGEYLTWNGQTGSLGSGIIPPFQGFWIKANAPAPVLKVKSTAKTSGGNFLRKGIKGQNSDSDEAEDSAYPVLEIRAEGNNLSKTTHVMLSSGAKFGRDEKDALRLLPFSTSHIELYSTLSNGTELAINNLPRLFEHRQNIPLHFQAFKDGNTASGSYTLSIPGMRSIPEDWLIILIDHKTGEHINFREQNSYTFSYSSKAKLFKAQPTQGSPAKKKSKKKARFTLRITTADIEAAIPEDFYIYQNYPNPFNPATTIPFGLTEETDVRLEVFDILGRKVQTLISGKLPAGTHTVKFNAASLASGIYLYRIITDRKVKTRKMVLIK